MKTIKFLILICFLFIIVGFFVVPGFYILDKGKTVISQPSINNTLGIYVINMPKATQRKESIIPFIKDLNFPYEVIKAHDWRELDSMTINEHTDIATFSKLTGMPPKMGEIACYMSHVEVWKKFVKSNYEFALIFEDDVKIDKNELLRKIDLLIKNKKYWDMNSFAIDDDKTIKIKQLDEKYSLNLILSEAKNAGLVIYNKKAAARLLKHAYPIRIPLDKFIYRNWETKLKSTVILPKSELYDNDNSYVENSKYVNKEHYRGVYNIFFNIKTTIIKYIYNGIYAFKTQQEKALI